jgi:hypothetical protein
MLAIFIILTCAISPILYKRMVMTVHNQCSGIELVSPVYFCNCETYYEYPVKRTGLSAMMKIDFRFDPNQDELKGILICEMQRKGNTKSDRQLNTDITFNEAIEGTSRMMRLLAVWKIKRFGEHKVHIILVECDNKLVLNEDKLEKLYDKVNDIFLEYNPSKWLMSDNTVLGTSYMITREEGTELNIRISEETEKKYTMGPMWIDSERYVPFLMIIYFY